jgi:hypothetical protein
MNARSGARRTTASPFVTMTFNRFDASGGWGGHDGAAAQAS